MQTFIPAYSTEVGFKCYLFSLKSQRGTKLTYKVVVKQLERRAFISAVS